MALALCAPAVVAAAAMSAESVNNVFLIFVSSVREMRLLRYALRIRIPESPTVGLHLNFRGNVTELSARSPHPFLRETLSETAALPFSVGEKLTYEVRVANGGKVGTATMWIEGPVDVRGTSTYLLRFDSRIRIAFLSAVSSSSSWFDPLRGSSLRFLKHERNPLTHNDESVDLYPDQKEWKSAKGETGQSPSNTPLDELSFMYFIRTLPMTPGATYRFDRHFDPARNPTTVSVIRRESNSDSDGRAAGDPGRDARA